MRTDPTAISRGRKHEGITTFIVDMELPGIDIRPIREITGDSLFCEVFFTDAKLPVGDRLGDEGNGWLVSMGALGQERVGSAGQAISMAQDLRTLLQTAKAENPDALRDPAIRERVAKLHIQIEATRLLIARALSKVLKGEKGWPEVPLAKLQWGYISLWLAELALDILGPTGALLKGAPGAIDGGMWARNYVWQRYTTIGAGPTEVQKNIIADRALEARALAHEPARRERGEVELRCPAQHDVGDELSREWPEQQAVGAVAGRDVHVRRVPGARRGSACRRRSSAAAPPAPPAAARSRARA